MTLSCYSFRFEQVFRARTPPDAIQLVSRLLEYTPSARITPLQACAHPFFNELRESNQQLPNGRDLPPLFNFTEAGLSARSIDETPSIGKLDQLLC